MIDAIAKILQLAPRYLAVIAIACGVYLFAPAEWIAKIGLDNLDEKYRPYIGGAFLISTGVTIVGVASWIGVFGFAFARAGGIKRKAIKRLHSLTENEKQILRFYIAKQTKSNTLRFDDGVVQGLVSANIIYRSTDFGNMVEGFSYNIQDFAWERLNENPNLLIGTTTVARTDERTDHWW